MFPPIFPVYIPALVPLYPYAPLIWLGGVLCLWLTRYTHQLGKRLGRAYYAFSALIRPAGVLLIGIGWLALYAPEDVPAPFRMPGGLYQLPWLPTRSATEALCWLAALGFFAFGIWAVVTLGLRRSFLYRSVDDRLITSGPYALVRHPQFLATIGMTFFATRVFQPQAFPYFGGGYIHSVDANWMLFTLALWVLAVLEDRELAAHFPEYGAYARSVPRLFPN